MPLHSRFLALTSLLLTVHHACAQSTTRDSAGIQIVSSSRPGVTSAQWPHLSAKPIVTIGNRPGDPYEFSRIAGAARLSDGRIVVGNGASQQLRFFDSSGKFVSSIGRKGDGPGEFQQLGQLSLASGDTIVAGSLSSLSLFTAQGKFVRTTDPFNPPVQLPRGERMMLAAFANGTSLMGSIARPADTRRVPQSGYRWTEPIALAVVGKGNQVVSVVDAQPARVMQWDQLDLLEPLFAPEMQVAPGEKSWWYGFGSEYSIRQYSLNGKLTRIIRRTWVPAAIDYDSWLTRRPKLSANAARFSSLPAFNGLLADRSGRLWVRAANADDYPRRALTLLPSRWSVFDVSGKWSVDVTMPAHFTPTDIGNDYVLGVLRDDDEVESVVMYRLGQGTRN